METVEAVVDDEASLDDDDGGIRLSLIPFLFFFLL